MPDLLYDKPLWQIIQQEFLAEAPETFSLADAIEWFRTRYPKFQERSIRGHLRSMSANNPAAQRFRPSLPHDVFFELGGGLYRRYDAERDGPYDELEVPVRDSDEIDEEEEAYTAEAAEGKMEFVLEAHLEEFIEVNWRHINFGRPLELYIAESGRSGRQFPTDIGAIDFLATDTSSNGFVVIELKKGRSSDKVLGQCQRYMGWVQENLAKAGQKVRGLIVAPEQDDRLRYALKVAPDVQMLCYRVDFHLFSPTEERRA